MQNRQALNASWAILPALIGLSAFGATIITNYPKNGSVPMARITIGPKLLTFTSLSTFQAGLTNYVERAANAQYREADLTPAIGGIDPAFQRAASASVIPEPAVLLLIGFGLLAVALFYMRRGV